MDGSSNYHLWNGTYDSATGKFTGTMTTNLCSNDHWGYCALCDPPGYLPYANHTATCVDQVFPAPAYETAPSAAALRGRVGLSTNGVNIYGPEEAGFGFGMNPSPCTDGSGTCYAGVDVPTCEASLDITCGNSSKVVHSLMLDTCGGHAIPYHYHNDLACDYDHTFQGHSPLIGFALDGYGIYGLYESYDETSETQIRPTNLDTCNGHMAIAPENTSYGVPYSLDAIYHYHTTSWAPYTIGCYGPIESQDACKSLYDTSSSLSGQCNTGIYPIYTPDSPEGYCYDTDCPCFDGSTDRYGTNTNQTIAECSCYDQCDVTGSGCSYTCDELVNDQGLDCETYYCPNCTYAGFCDKECGYGACA